MARFKNYTRSLASSYVLLLANTVFTLGSYRMGLNYLAPAEFGLWALTWQVAGFIALMDLGITGSLGRILVDYKDRPASSDYGSMLITGFLVNLAQAVLVLVAGTACVLIATPWILKDTQFASEFKWLLFGQVLLIAGTFATRICTIVLSAHQRFDVPNNAQSISFVVGFVTLWAAFEFHAGVFSILASQLAMFVVTTSLTVGSCFRLKLMPARGNWGRPSWARFKHVFLFGLDVFLYSLGAQLVNASQTILISRELGPAEVTLWAFGSRTFQLAAMIVYRIFDVSCPALAEMIVRQEREVLLGRFRNIISLSASLAVIGGVFITFVNQTFVEVWSHGKVAWSMANDALLGCWLISVVIMHAHVGLVGQTKQFRALRYLYFAEGITFVLLATNVLQPGGITAMLIASNLCTLLFTLPYGLFRTHEYFRLPWRDVALRWCRPAILLAMALVPAAFGWWWVTKGMPAIPRLATLGTGLAITSAVLGWAFGIEPGLRRDLLARVRGRFGSRKVNT